MRAAEQMRLALAAEWPSSSSSSAAVRVRTESVAQSTDSADSKRELSEPNSIASGLALTDEPVIEHAGSGEFAVTYVAAAPGNFLLEVALYGEHIQDSPKSVLVR